VVPVEPTLVFVNFGMNDGGCKPFQQSVYDAYLASQEELAARIENIGAREVQFTTEGHHELLFKVTQGAEASASPSRHRGTARATSAPAGAREIP
jgi:hypothetical protein